MRHSLVTLMAGASVLLPGLALAQTKTVVLDGLRADIAVTPSGSYSKSMAGNSKQDILDMVDKASPSTIILPGNLPAPNQVVR